MFSFLQVVLFCFQIQEFGVFIRCVVCLSCGALLFLQVVSSSYKSSIIKESRGKVNESHKPRSLTPPLNGGGVKRAVQDSHLDS